MIEFKELSSLKYEEYVKPPKEQLIDKGRNWRGQASHFYYTAFVHITKKGVETLVVPMYAQVHKTKAARWQLSEIHYINELGDVVAAAYDAEKKELRRGNFRVGNGLFTNEDAPYWWSIADSLSWGNGGREVLPIGSASETVLDFAKRHKELNKITQHKHETGIGWVSDYRDSLADNKAAAARERHVKKVKDFLALAPDPPKEFNAWATKEVLSRSVWFYSYDRKSKLQSGKCAACGKKSKLAGIKDKKLIHCPKCGAEVVCTNAASTRFSYSKCASESFSGYVKYNQQLGHNDYVTRFYYVSSRYMFYADSGKIVRADEFIEERREYFKVEGKGLMVYAGYTSKDGWDKISPRRLWICSTGVTYPYNIIDIVQSFGIPEIHNVDFRPLCKLEITFTRTVRMVKDCPMIENLGKMGLYNLARDYIYGGRSYSGKSTSPAKALGIPRPILEEFAKFDINSEEFQMWRDWNLSIKSLSDFRRICEMCRGHYSTLRDIMRYGVTLKRAANYMEKQIKKNSAKDALMYWKDYISAAKQLGMDIVNDKDLLYPPDVKKEHDRCTKLVKIKKNEAHERALAKRNEILNKLSYKDKKYLIRPLINLDEFVKESEKLDHCVKQYYKRCCEGETNIFALRNINKPDEPFFTVNINNMGKLIQNRGKSNCSPPPEVKAFVKKWLKSVAKRLETTSLSPEQIQNQVKIQIGA